MISPVENPMITSKWLALLVTEFTSWLRQCALVKRILVKYSAFVGEDRSNHWKARLMFANAKVPSFALSAIFLENVSLMMTREMKDELLFVILFFGFRRLFGSFNLSGARRAFPSPNAGADTAVAEPCPPTSLTDVPLPSPSLLILASLDNLHSLGCSAILPGNAVVAVSL